MDDKVVQIAHGRKNTDIRFDRLYVENNPGNKSWCEEHKTHHDYEGGGIWACPLCREGLSRWGFWDIVGFNMGWIVPVLIGFAIVCAILYFLS